MDSYTANIFLMAHKQENLKVTLFHIIVTSSNIHYVISLFGCCCLEFHYLHPEQIRLYFACFCVYFLPDFHVCLTLTRISWQLRGWMDISVSWKNERNWSESDCELFLNSVHLSTSQIISLVHKVKFQTRMRGNMSCVLCLIWGLTKELLNTVPSMWITP